MKSFYFLFLVVFPRATLISFLTFGFFLSRSAEDAKKMVELAQKANEESLEKVSHQRVIDRSVQKKEHVL